MWNADESWFAVEGLTCRLCMKRCEGIGSRIGICPECLRDRWEESRKHIQTLHSLSRKVFGLPALPPDNPQGISCRICQHRCRMGAEDEGYCGVRGGNGASMRRDGRRLAKALYYHDLIPTNCVADWVCAGGTGAGYPEYAYEEGPEAGYCNLAVFFEACNFNCLYCQNWSFKELQRKERRPVSPESLSYAVNPQTSCVCFFGGDPTPQIPFALRASRIMREKHPHKILRFCWETNGSAHPAWMKRMAQLSLESGGCVKIDLKAWTPQIHQALCGCDNRLVLENFARLAGWGARRPDPPLLVASTVMVPGYVGVEEISRIASFIAKLDPDIPYALLAFAPEFLLNDFPTTSKDQAFACLEAAKRAGLRRVRIGNRHLLCC